MSELKFEGYKRSLTEDEIQNFEISKDITLPEHYRQYLKEYNGGSVEPNLYYNPETKVGFTVDVFHPLISGRKKTDLPNLDLFYEINRKRYPDGLINIGMDDFGNVILISAKGDKRGAIFFYYHDRDFDDTEDGSFENIEEVASDFEEFLSRIRDYDESLEFDNW